MTGGGPPGVTEGTGDGKEEDGIHRLDEVEGIPCG